IDNTRGLRRYRTGTEHDDLYGYRVVYQMNCTSHMQLICKCNKVAITTPICSPHGHMHQRTRVCLMITRLLPFHHSAPSTAATTFTQWAIATVLGVLCMVQTPSIHAQAIR